VTKADVVKQWKPELEPLGFAFRQGLFLHERPEPGHLDLGVSVQRSTSSDTYKIGPSILLRNPLREGSPLELLLMGTLRGDGIFLHVTRSSWWSPEALPDALRALRQHVIGWYRRVGRIDYLAVAAETAIERTEDLARVIEPMDPAVTTLPWAPDTPRRLGRAFFYRAAVLHHLNGDRARALGRTRDWLQAIPDREAAERARAQAQLAALGEGPP
jgi:hypothetical protein